ncbi:MAG: hypothetical protein WA783_15480 [Phormidesmis sp.]
MADEKGLKICKGESYLGWQSVALALGLAFMQVGLAELGSVQNRVTLCNQNISSARHLTGLYWVT